VDATAPGGAAIGQGAHALLADAIAIGTSSHAGGEQSLALGAGAVSQHYLGVALGAGSVADPVVTTASGSFNGVMYNYAGGAPVSTVSVGAAGAERTITNLGAGQVSAASTDAINGSQLFAAQQAIGEVSAVANAGSTVSAQGANATQIAPGSATGTSIDLNNGDTNLIISKTAGSNDVTFNLATDITVDSVTTGDTTMGTSGVTISGGPNGTVALSSSGLDNGGNRITNVAAGVNLSDAVNVSQLSAAIGNVSLGFTGNSGGTVTNSNGQVLTIQGTGATAGTYSGDNIRTVIDPGSGSVNIEIAEAPKFGTVTVNENGSGRITGVTGANLSSTSLDAVNGSQLVALGDSIAATLSPGSTYSAATNSVTAQIVLGSNVYSTVQDALQAVNANVGGTWNVTTAATGSGVVTGSDVKEVAGGAMVTFTAGNNVMIQQNGSEVQVALNPNLAGVQSLAIAGGPTLNGGGIDMNGGRITNLATGIAPTDAVNLGQLTSGLSNTLNQANQYTDAAVSRLMFDLSDYRRDANGGTAAAMAMGTVPQAFEPGMGIMGFGMSTWQGEQAIAIGFSKASDNGRLLLKATGSYNTRNQGGAAVGMGFQF
jgi:autotransporter adhesin